MLERKKKLKEVQVGFTVHNRKTRDVETHHVAFIFYHLRNSTIQLNIVRALAEANYNHTLVAKCKNNYTISFFIFTYSYYINSCREYGLI